MTSLRRTLTGPVGRALAVASVTLAALLAPLIVATGPAGAGAPDLCLNNATYTYVCNGYRAYDRRNPSTDELEYWALQSPFPRTQFNAMLGRSLDSRRVTVRAYYDHYGDHDPNAGELAFWVAEIPKPGGQRRLEVALLGNYTGMIDGFLSKTYATELGRDPNPAERDYWGTRTAQIGRNKVAAQISASLEARRAKVVFAYGRELNVMPDIPGRDYWTERLRTGLSFLELRIALRGSTLATSGYCSSPAARPGAPCV